MRVRLNVVLAGVMLSATVVSAQPSVRPASAGAQRVSRDVQSAAIHGIVIDSERKPVRNARLRLRNLELGEIEQVATSDERGEFSFVAQPDVRYVVEIPEASGRVIAVGDVTSARTGEVARTIVLLSTRLPARAGLFTETATSVIAAATAVGLTVVDPALPKVSPTR